MTIAESRRRVAGPTGAAAKLGLHPMTLDYRIQALRIDKHRFKRPTSTTSLVIMVASLA